jgi:hypothetical protein
LLHGHDLRPELDASSGLEQNRLKIASVDGDRALEEVARQRGQLATGRCQDRAVPCRRARGADGVCNPEQPQRVHRVCEQTDASPDYIELRRALEHDNVVLSATQCDRRGQPANTTTDDDHSHAMPRF